MSEKCPICGSDAVEKLDNRICGDCRTSWTEDAELADLRAAVERVKAEMNSLWENSGEHFDTTQTAYDKGRFAMATDAMAILAILDGEGKG